MQRVRGYWCRNYGSESTHLWLSPTAERYYSGTDPIAIWELEIEPGDEDEDEDGETEYGYILDEAGCLYPSDYDDRDYYTEAELNAALEEMQADLDAMDEDENENDDEEE